ncbi:MAG: ribosome biogenesis GTPase Der [Chloroflexi bacterium]|nr:ribosome biogenesis GTPase Der [Chloroflexota bacterium]
MNIPIITIIGRPNVGKSTLFNRIAGRRISIVSNIPGTTRDRISFTTQWGNNKFGIIDTAGINHKNQGDLSEEVTYQYSEAIRNSDLLVFLLDINDGLTIPDIQISNTIRKSGKPFVLAINKVDSSSKEIGLLEFYSLGMGDPFPISAYHNSGISNLMEKLLTLIPKYPINDKQKKEFRVSIVGRPNVGKSSIFNSIIKSNRSIVSSIPGTTRDSIDSNYDFEGKNILFIDTAGLKKRGKTKIGLEKYSMLRTINSIERSHISVLVLDTKELITDQDTHIGGYIDQASRGYLIVINKWDLSTKLNINHNLITKKINERFKFMEGAPLIFTSAITGYGIKKIIPSIINVRNEFNKKINSDDLNNSLLKYISENPLPRAGNRRPKIFKVSQTRVAPPTFSFESSNPKLIHFSYRRFLQNNIRKEFGFNGSPIVMNFKHKSNE